MEKQDILFKTGEGLFSYRVAGILILDGKVLLQRTPDDPTYAFPGGHVNFGEASADALVREFKEEVAVNILPERLAWIGENFFPWGGRECHQVCFYYLVSLKQGSQMPVEGSFFIQNELEGTRLDLVFSWIPLSGLGEITLYPTNAQEKLANLTDGVEHFVFKQ